jgi:hypothetical protein
VTTTVVEHVGPDGEVSRLPAGERVLWQGAPDRRALARFLLRERWVLGFVGFSFAIGAADAMQHPTAAIPRLIGVATLSLILALIAVVSIRLFAWRLAETSSYVITDKRVYFNIGIVLRADANVPYSIVEGVDLLRRPDGSADLMVSLGGTQEIPWLLLFPHMSWRGSRRGRPTFRGIREPDLAAAAVVGALRAYVGSAATVNVAAESVAGRPSSSGVAAPMHA